MQWAEIDQVMEAVFRRQRRSEPLDPVLDVLRRQTDERPQVEPDDTEVVPLVGVTSDAIPAAMSRLICDEEDGSTEPAVAAAGTNRQMVKVLCGGAGHRRPTAARARAIV